MQLDMLMKELCSFHSLSNLLESSAKNKLGNLLFALVPNSVLNLNLGQPSSFLVPFDLCCFSLVECEKAN